MWYEPYTITNIWILLGIALGFGIYECFWRRLYGGWISHWWKSNKYLKCVKPRFIYTIINCIAIFSICQWVRGLMWYWSLYVTCVIQFLYWALAHGPWFDLGRDTNPSDKTLKRYNKFFYHYILDWCFPEATRYTPFYDFCGMWLRYVWMLFLLLIVPTFSFGLINLGSFVAVTYGVCWVAQDKKLLKKLGPTELSEFIVGFLTGLFLVLS